MGISPLPQLVPFDFNGNIQDNKEEMSESNGSLWSKLVEAQANNKKRWGKVIKKKQRILTTRRKLRGNIVWSCRRRPRSIMMKRRINGNGGNIVEEGCRRSRRPIKSPIEKKIKTLKKLIPSNEKPMGLDGLFRETADYILALQMRVKVMQIMVEALTEGSDE